MLLRRARGQPRSPQAATGRWMRQGSRIIVFESPRMRLPASSPLQETPAWTSEVGFANKDHIAWAQRSLNQVLGSGLIVDGVVGSETQRAIRAFQQSEGLVVDGVFGSVTEAALLAAVASANPSLPSFGLVAPPCGLLDQPSEDLEEFGFNDHTLRPSHQPQILNIARCIIASQSTPQPIRSVQLVGHTDPVGTEAFNFQLGLRRATEVKTRLLRELESRSPGLGPALQLVENSRGETELVPSSNTRSRRVQVELRTTTMPAPACPCASFFAEYELRFNPGSPNFGIPANTRMAPAEKAQRSADVLAMVNELLPRRDRRATDALRGLTMPALPVTGNTLAIARRLSAGQRDLYRQCLPDGKGGINFIALRHCFESFTNGDLRNPAAGQAVGEQGVGEPDGGFYFLFAEFAFLCLDSGIDVAVWGEALRVFVETQEIFMHVYRPPPRLSAPPAITAASPAAGPRRRDLDDVPGRPGYRNAHHNAAGESNGARRAAARAKYAVMDLPAMRMAARDNMVRALCAP
jgi:outer membrane protein OmpA-like peptidoglycan-associated protein